MKKRSVLFNVLSLLAVLSPLALTGCQSQQEKFNSFADEVLYELLVEDQLTINLYFKDAEKYGFEHYDAKWYKYEKTQPGEMEAIVAENERLLGLLKKFKYDSLTELQKTTYYQLEEMFEYNIAMYSVPNYEFYNLFYIDQFGGYVESVASYMETYSLRKEQDVKDMINCLKSTEEAFISYLDFAQDKLDHGYPYSDFTLNEMTSYLKDLLDQGDEYYLYDYLDYKIESCTFLTDSQIESYKLEAKDALKNDFFVGVSGLYEGLPQFLHKANANLSGYWAGYGDIGKYFYELEIKNVLGMPNLDLEQYIATLESEISRTSALVSQTFTTLSIKHKITSEASLDSYIKYYPICKGTPEEKMEYLKEFAKTIVPDLKQEPEITIKEMDESAAKKSNATAYYTKSAVDEFDHEFITLNPLALGNDNDVLGTLSHEGYPGHLYEYVHSKELGLHPLSILRTNLTHGEGWATYVEYALYDYAYENATGTDSKAITKARDVIKYLQANHESGYLLECRIDVGIHYEGWTVSKVASYLGGLGYNSGAAQEIYDLIIEMPARYQAYGYGKYFFIKLHKDAKRALGEAYNEVEYNTALLSKGWVGLEMLQENHDAYIASKQG